MKKKNTKKIVGFTPAPNFKKKGNLVRGFTCGAFDLTHAGHYLMFEEVRKQCDYLIVGLQIDPSIDREEKNKPIQSMEERFIQLKACRYIDKIEIYNTEKSLLTLLKKIKPDVRFMGEDWKDKPNYSRDMLPNMKVVYNSRDHDYSTRKLRKKVLEGELNRTTNKKVFVSGCYDILHGGHIEFFNQAKALGDYLIVCFAGDEVLYRHKHKKTSIPEAHKRKILESLRMIDEVVMGNDLEELGLDFKQHFLRIKPDILAVTEDDKFGKEKIALCNEIGAQYIVLPKTLDFDKISTTEIIMKIKNGK